MQVLKSVLNGFKSTLLFEWMAGYRGQAGALFLIYSGLIGLVFGEVPIPTGQEGIVWQSISPELAFTSLSAGLAALGIRKAKQINGGGK